MMRLGSYKKIWQWHKVNKRVTLTLEEETYLQGMNWVYIKVPHMKGIIRQLWRKGKLSLRYIGASQVVKKIGLVADKVALPVKFGDYTLYSMSSLWGNVSKSRNPK